MRWNKILDKYFIIVFVMLNKSLKRSNINYENINQEININKNKNQFFTFSSFLDAWIFWTSFDLTCRKFWPPSKGLAT